jgi:tetratricopeptide (TPR) repeat protein
MRTICALGLMVWFIGPACPAKDELSDDSLSNDLPVYDLDIRLHPAERRMEVDGKINLPATNAPREQCRLVLSTQMHDFRVNVLAPSGCEGDAKLEELKTVKGQTTWAIKPPHSVPAGSPVRLQIAYGGGEKSESQFDFQPECCIASGYGTNWYPQVEGNNDRGTGFLSFAVPSGYIVRASGSLVSNKKDQEQGRFRYKICQPSTLCFAAGKYKVFEKGTSVPIRVCLLRDRPDVEKTVGRCAQIMDFLVRRYGPYPYGEFVLCEVPVQQADRAGFLGASTEGLLYVSSAMLDKEFTYWYFGHEMSHQWWGNLVRPTGPRGNYIFTEAMAHLSGLRTVEEFEGAAAAERFRRGDMQGGRFGYFLRVAAGLDHRLSDLPIAASSLDLAWSKGFLVLDMLAREMGEEQLAVALQHMLKQYAYKSMTWEEFVHSLEGSSPKDLKWFFEQWFDRTGAPEWQLSWKQLSDGTVEGDITQVAPNYTADVVVKVQGMHDELAIQKVTVRNEHTRFMIDPKFHAGAVILDPNFQVLHWTPEYRAEAKAVAPYFLANIERERGRLTHAEEMFKDALAKVPSVDLYAERFLLQYGLARVYADQKKTKEAKEHLDAALASPTRRAETLPWAYYGYGVYAKALNDEGLLRWSVSAAASADAVAPMPTGAAELARTLLPSGR